MRKTILVIEQEASVVGGLKSILEKEGYRVETDFRYLESLPAGRPLDLIMLSIYAPKELGLNILRKTKKLFPSVPVLVTSVYSHSISLEEIRGLGADDFIAKPFDIPQLKERIEKLIHGSHESS